MAENWLSALELVRTLLTKLYDKYSQLKETKKLCVSLHTRLENFTNALKNIKPDTFEEENQLSRLHDLIQEYSDTVTEYSEESNFVKRVLKVNEFVAKIKAYNESLDNIFSIITVNQAANLVEWRTQYNRDTEDLTKWLMHMYERQGDILKAIDQLPNKRDIEDLVLVAKRDLEDRSQALNPVMHSFVDIAQGNFLDGMEMKKPPTWLIAAHEYSTSTKIDSKGSTTISMGEWQGIRVAVKKFFTAGENPVFDKHLKIWRTLQHLHVAQLYGAGSDKGARFFVYEYAGCRSLDLYWDKLSQNELWRLLHQAALGLAYLHKKRIVHGNLSCSKLLVTDQGVVKLFGFGASYVREDNKSNSMQPVTHEDFAAPECTAGGIRHSPRFASDVYSFGLTIMEAISKKNPFCDVNREDISEMKRNNRLPKPLAMTNDEAWILVKQMCLSDPNQRASLKFVTEQLGRFAREADTVSE